jgi:uncharacterized protein (DUF1697 family)
MNVFVAFLRGINVGGNKTVSMAKLKTLFETLGFEAVKTHLNSGNVVFADSGRSDAKLAETLEDAIEQEFGFRPAVIVRSAAELKRIVEKNPFAKMAKDDPSHLIVMLLASRPGKDAATRIAKAHAGVEEIRITGDVVFVTYPNGVGRSKLTNVFLEKQLDVTGTARNWNTVVKLIEIAARD